MLRWNVWSEMVRLIPLGVALAMSATAAFAAGPSSPEEIAATIKLNRDVATANAEADLRYAESKQQYDAGKSENDTLQREYAAGKEENDRLQRQYQEAKKQNDLLQQQYQEKLKAYQAAHHPASP